MSTGDAADDAADDAAADAHCVVCVVAYCCAGSTGLTAAGSLSN